MKSRAWFASQELLCTLIAGGADLLVTFDCHVIRTLKSLCNLMSQSQLSRGPTLTPMQANKPNNCMNRPDVCILHKWKAWRSKVISRAEYREFRWQYDTRIIIKMVCYFQCLCTETYFLILKSWNKMAAKYSLVIFFIFGILEVQLCNL